MNTYRSPYKPHDYKSDLYSVGFEVMSQKGHEENVTDLSTVTDPDAVIIPRLKMKYKASVDDIDAYWDHLVRTKSPDANLSEENDRDAQDSADIKSRIYALKIVDYIVTGGMGEFQNYNIPTNSTLIYILKTGDKPDGEVDITFYPDEDLYAGLQQYHDNEIDLFLNQINNELCNKYNMNPVEAVPPQP